MAFAKEDGMRRDLMLGRTTRRTMLKAGGAIAAGLAIAGRATPFVEAQETTLIYPWIVRMNRGERASSPIAARSSATRLVSVASDTKVSPQSAL